jgi:hypothetical protein
MVKKLLLSVLLVGALVCFAGAPLAQTAPIQQRIAQAIIVNGQQVQGVTVIQNGTVQSYTCPSPQQYVAADQSSSGWACFDEATGSWLMHALPQETANLYDQPQVYDNGPDTYGYYGYPYAYPYGYYPYPYYGYYGPSYLFGFGRGHYEHGHGYYAPRGHQHGGSFGHGSFGHGSFGHGGGGHMGGGHMGGGHMGGGHMGGGHMGGGHMGGGHMGGGHAGGGHR